MRRFTVLSFVLLSLNISCKIPPFNEEISRLVLLTSDMDEEAKVGPIDLGQGMEFLSLLRFVPEKANLERGFIVVNDIKVALAFVDENDNVYSYPEMTINPDMFDYDNSSNRYFNVTTQV